MGKNKRKFLTLEKPTKFGLNLTPFLTGNKGTMRVIHDLGNSSRRSLEIYDDIWYDGVISIRLPLKCIIK